MNEAQLIEKFVIDDQDPGVGPGVAGAPLPILRKYFKFLICN